MAPAPPASVRVFACGVTGSGKTRALRHLWLDKEPRALILDATGEWLQQRQVRVVHDLPGLLAELRRCASRDRWRIVAPVDQLDPAAVIERLLALGPGGATYPRAVNGMALVIDELSTFAHHSCSQRVAAAWTRGRHAGLTILGASQFPAQVNRAVTSQSEFWLVYPMHEPDHVRYLARVLPAPVMAAHAALEKHHAVFWSNERRAGYLLDPNYNDTLIAS